MPEADASGHPGPDVTLRSASLADVRAIAEFQTACWREAYRGIVPQAYLDVVTADDRERRWRERMTAGSRHIALAVSDAAVVGVVSWRGSDTPDLPALELTSLYVAAGHRGSGTAAELLTLALSSSPAYLWVFENNPRAQAFYSKHNFRFDGRRNHDADTGLWERQLVRH